MEAEEKKKQCNPKWSNFGKDKS